jgi:hypothetical protein
MMQLRPSFSTAIRLLGIVMFRQVGYCDVGAFACEQHCNRPPNTRISTRDQGHLSLQFLGPFIVRGIVHRRGRETGFLARLWMMLLRKWRLRIGARACLHRPAILLLPHLFSAVNLLLNGALDGEPTDAEDATASAHGRLPPKKLTVHELQKHDIFTR